MSCDCCECCAPKPDEHNEHAESAGKIERIGKGVGAGIFAIGLVAEFTPALHFSPQVSFGLFLASWLLVGGEVALHALKNIMRGKVFDENFLMVIASLGAFCIGEYAEGAAVMLFYQVGEAFEDRAVGRSRKSIAGLMDIRPDFANLKTADGMKRVSPEEVAIGDLIVVRPGEKVPLDGIVVEGHSALDTSALTGESLPRDVEEGSNVLSGSVNANGLLVIRVTQVFGESTVSRILDLVQNAGSKKSVTENFITSFARYYTPAVVIAALALALVPPLVLPNAAFIDWVRRALVFLVVSCPCALVISIPLGFFGGIGGASRSGILIKGSNYLEALNYVDTVVFDKTGTLTKGVFRVTGIFPAMGIDDAWTNEKLLDYAAHAESFSTHPIAVSIRNAFTGTIGGGGTIDQNRIADYEEVSGYGVRILIDGKRVLAGNARLLTEARVDISESDLNANNAAGSCVYLSVEWKYVGRIVIADELKADSKDAVRGLKSLGIRKIVMLTGDGRAAAEKAAEGIALDEIIADVLPHQKVERIEVLAEQKPPKGKLVFVGDGINDAPALARSDVGIAMGGVGSDAAIEAADIVFMTDEPSKLIDAIRIAKKTHGIVRQNIVFALGVKAAILALGALGMATMWAAVFGDVGVAVIAILNAMRAMKHKGIK